MVYACPVCGYDKLPRPAEDYLICPSCGTEFGYTDFRTKHSELRRLWIESGARWQSHVIQPPPNWSWSEQLRLAGFDVPTIQGRLKSIAETNTYDPGAQIQQSNRPSVDYRLFSPVPA